MQRERSRLSQALADRKKPKPIPEPSAADVGARVLEAQRTASAGVVEAIAELGQALDTDLTALQEAVEAAIGRAVDAVAVTSQSVTQAVEAAKVEPPDLSPVLEAIDGIAFELDVGEVATVVGEEVRRVVKATPVEVQVDQKDTWVFSVEYNDDGSISQVVAS